MSKPILILVFVLLAGINNIFATPIWMNSLSDEGRRELAESYRAVSEAYTNGGKLALGEQFLAVARQLESTLPPVNPQSPPPVESSESELPAMGNPSVIEPTEEPAETHSFYDDNSHGTPTQSTLTLFSSNQSTVLISQPDVEQEEFGNAKKKNSIVKNEVIQTPQERVLTFPDTSEYTTTEQLQLAVFFTYIEGWLQEDVDKVLTSLTSSMNLPLYPRGLNPEEQRIFFTDFFASYQLSSLDVSDLYDLSTLSIVQFGDDRALLTVTSAQQAPAELDDWAYWSNFWHSNHHLFFQRVGVNRWRLISFDMEATR